MDIRRHLRQGESVISDHEPFYATSQRVIHLVETNGVNEAWELPYARLTSVEVVKLPRHKMLIAGTLLVVSGAILTTVGYLTGWVTILVGVAAMGYGGIGREAYYQFHGHGMSEKEESLWRMVYWGSGSFIRTIRTVTGERPPD